MGCGCGSIGRAVTSNTSGFSRLNPVIVEFLHLAFIYCQLYWQDNKKRPGMAKIAAELVEGLLQATPCQMSTQHMSKKIIT